MAHELQLCDIRFERQRPLPIEYKGIKLDYGYRLDFVVEDVMVLEVKAVEHLAGIHEAQLLTYLRLGGYQTGLLINFHAETLRRGLRRLTLK